MQRGRISRYLSYSVTLSIALLLIGYGLWATSGFVWAFRTQKTVHIFPTTVSSLGWQNSEASLTQEVVFDGPFDSFGPQNAAYILIERDAQISPDEIVAPDEILLPEIVPTDDGSEDMETDEVQDEQVPVELDETEPDLPGTEEDVPADSISPAASGDESVSPPSDIAPPQTQDENVPSEAPAVPESVPSLDIEAHAPNTYLSFALQELSSAAWFVISHSVSTVYATTSEELLGEDNEQIGAVSETYSASSDVATCTILSSECHTVVLEGFGVSGDLTDKRLQGMTLNFSFASRAPESADADDRLVVRYFHEGRWRLAGEIFLNKEMSNASNGGYFTNSLPDLTSWSDLADLKIEFEYEGTGDHAAELYLDAVWVDAVYTDRAQDLLRGDTDQLPSDIPENVSEKLNERHTTQTLVLSGGDTIEFPYLDDVDDLLMRVDRPSYDSRRETDSGDVSYNTIYASITNSGRTKETFDLQVAFPEGQGSVIELSQYMRNVPSDVETLLYDDVTYFCEAGWVLVDSQYSCAATGQHEPCTSLNDSGDKCLVEQVQVGSEQSIEYQSAWVPRTIETPLALVSEDSLPSEYISVASGRAFEILPRQTVYFKIVLESPDVGAQRFVLLAQGASMSGDIESELLRGEDEVRAYEPDAGKKVRVNKRLSTRTNFEGDELPSFRFQFKTQRGVIARVWDRLLRRSETFDVRQARIMHEGGEYESVPIRVAYDANSEWSLELKEHPRGFKPGKYTIEISVQEGAETFVDTFDFYWGILAVNTRKATYAPGEEANLMMAVLDQRGDTICDANIDLVVVDPLGVARTLPVEQSGACGANNVTDIADYAARMTVGAPGSYTVLMAELDDEGTVMHRITDSFDVQEKVPFVIERGGATRIYPAADYTMQLEVTATEDFSGEFIEAMPTDFTVVDAGGGDVRLFGGARRIVWPLDLKAGETMTVAYTYDAPDISPYMYMLGPAEVREGDAMPFSESRQWKLASDAVGSMLLFWDQAWIPTGWTCVSCLPSDPFYQRFIMGSSTAGVNGGAATHTHTATGAVADTGAAGDSNDTGGTADVALIGHDHTYTPIIGATSSLPQYRELAVIQYNTTGEPTSIPAGAIAIFDVASSSLPTSWYRLAAQDGRFVRPASTSTRGTIGGSPTHIHSISGSTDPATGGANANGSGVQIAQDDHTHIVTSNTGFVNHEPPYIGALLARLSATSSPANDMIAMWSADPPTYGWETVSSSTEPFENRFVQATTTYGTTGGASSHSHANVTGINSLGPSATSNRTTTGALNAPTGHTHSISVTAFTTNAHLPPYRTAVFAKRDLDAVPVITTHLPFDSEKSGTSTPYFEFTANDPDGSTDLVYQIQWDDDEDLDVSPLGDHSSDDESGCSPDCFENVTTPADTSPFTEAQRVRFSMQSALVSGTTYYWRVRATQNGGVAVGDWSTTTSYTYVADTLPSQWFQTEDAQFDGGTHSSTQTTGSGSVELVIPPLVEAITVYAEGTVQTPRYQTWDGDSWSGEGSAQSVGGDIQWIVTKPSPTRNEYVMGTQDALNDVNVQVFDADAGTWGDLQEVTAGLDDNTMRGFDIAYESASGDAIVVYCDGDADPSYYVWNGSGWVFGSSIDLTLTNDCELIKLASHPTNDQIVLVARDTAASASDYQVAHWNGSAWTVGIALGSMSEVAHEGMAIEFEESGNQAIVTVSNGGTAGFVWTAWDTTLSEWTPATPFALGDDFEWGYMARDDGSDNLGLCYSDQDDDLGSIIWTGDGWATFVEVTNEFEGTGNTNDGAGSGTIEGRPFSCQFETSAGRDGYLMIPYSDNANGRYQFWNGSAHSGEASLSTITNSWTVASIRTGDGLVFSMFHDDPNDRYDFSFWNGTTWSTRDPLETNAAVGAAPFREAFSMAPRVYQANSGTHTSSPIDFDSVPNQVTWGEITWETTEPSGTDVTIQVLDGSSGACGAALSDVVLPGNSSGFQVTSSPLDISGVSTTTYSGLCLEATLTTTSSNVPSLDSWTLSWVRSPYLTQTHYKWYANTTSLTPSDPWPSGAANIDEDLPIVDESSPSIGNVLRLRTAVLTENVGLPSSGVSLRLQYAPSATCSSVTQWFDVGQIGSTTAAWRGYDVSGITDGATLPSVLLTASDVTATYEEQNNSAYNPNSAAEDQETEWDWALEHNGAAGTDYCFR